MGRLTGLKPRLVSLPASIGFIAERDAHGHSRAAEPWRRWYSLARWKRLRLQVLRRDLFTCQAPGCGRVIGESAQLVADHVRPHRGDPTLFWDEGNLQALCKPCHDGAKQAAERAGRGARA